MKKPPVRPSEMGDQTSVTKVEGEDEVVENISDKVEDIMPVERAEANDAEGVQHRGEGMAE